MTRARSLGTWTVVAAVAVLLAGCKGNTGAPGTAGTPGAQGPTGPMGPSGPGGNMQPFDTTLELSEEMPGVNLTITGLSGASGAAFQPGDTISVTFTVELDNGTPIPLNELDSMRMWMAGPTTLYQKVTGNFNNIATGSVQNPDGSWTYSFTIPLAYPLQYNETGFFPENDGLSGQLLLSGTYTVCFRAYKNYWDTNGTRFRDVGNVTKDFLLGTATTLETRTVVSDAACNSCHGTLQMHGGGYQTTKLCITCHTTGAESSLDPVEAPKKEILDFRVMIHKLHNAAHLPSVNGVTVDAAGNKDYSLPPQTYMIGGHNFVEEVHFPVWPTGMPRDVGYDGLSGDEQDQEDEILDGITACGKCHVDPDGSGPLTLVDNNAFTTQSRRACGSCHDDIKWNQAYISNTALGMPAQPDDASCLGCHPAAGVQAAHVNPIHDSALNPGAVVTITAVGEDPADPNADMDGTVDVGEKVRVTLTLKNDAGADLNPSTINRVELLLGGPTENPQLFQRVYLPKDLLGATKPSYTFNVPEFWTLNYVGKYVANTTFPSVPVRKPFYTTADGWAPNVDVFEVTSVGPSSTLAAPALQGQAYLDVADGSVFQDENYIVVDPGGPNEQYYRIEALTSDMPNRLKFGRLATGSSSGGDFNTATLTYAPWVRTALPAGLTVARVTVTKRTLNTDYTVDAVNGQIMTTGGGAWAGNNPILLSAVTDFVLPATYRHGYTRQTEVNGSEGAWIGLPILSGTYGVKAGVTLSFSVVPPRNPGTGADDTSYTEGSLIAAGGSFRVGSATTLGSYPPILLSSATNCDACHAVPGQRMSFHGGGGTERVGAEYCYTCHGTARFGGGSPVTGRRTMRQMIHSFHMGSNLTFASVYENGAAEDIHFPMMPGGVKHCDKCHGNDSYEQPIARDHPNQIVPYRAYATVCLSCHDSTGARAHADLNTAPSGYESCVACHDPGSIYNVDMVHKNR